MIDVPFSPSTYKIAKTKPTRYIALWVSMHIGAKFQSKSGFSNQKVRQSICPYISRVCGAFFVSFYAKFPSKSGFMSQKVRQSFL